MHLELPKKKETNFEKTTLTPKCGYNQPMFYHLHSVFSYLWKQGNGIANINSEQRPDNVLIHFYSQWFLVLVLWLWCRVCGCVCSIYMAVSNIYSSIYFDQYIIYCVRKAFLKATSLCIFYWLKLVNYVHKELLDFECIYSHYSMPISPPFVGGKNLLWMFTHSTYSAAVSTYFPWPSPNTLLTLSHAAITRKWCNTKDTAVRNKHYL